MKTSRPVILAAILISLLLTGLLAWQPALADSFGPRGREFYDDIRQIHDRCENIESCAASPVQITTLYDIEKPEQIKLPMQILKKLRKISWLQAKIWADTILEDDYYADCESQLDSVQALILRGRVVGYRIRYSGRAWFTGNCGFDYENMATLKGCSPGWIAEWSFVSADLKTWFRDEQNFAAFSSTFPSVTTSRAR